MIHGMDPETILTQLRHAPITLLQLRLAVTLAKTGWPSVLASLFFLSDSEAIAHPGEQHHAGGVSTLMGHGFRDLCD